MVGTNMAFVRGLGVVIKSWREIFQRTVLRRVDLPVVRKVELSHIRCKEKCKSQTQAQDNDRSSFQSRIFRSLIYRTKNEICESRWKSLSISRSTHLPQLRKFGHFPILSLIGVTLGLDVSDLIGGKTEKMMSEMREVFEGYGWEAEPLVKLPQSLKDLDISAKSIAHGCEGAVFKAKLKTGDSESPTLVPPSEADEDFDLAVKAVFNYGAESNAHSILRELHRELLPLHTERGQDCQPVQKYINRLPPHPNIVDMPGIFVDDMLVTEQGIRDFPAALPQRLDSERFFGRSKTLYLVMRRRSTHLRDYLQREDITMAMRCLMLSQLLEGVSHLVDHGVAHRDLKTDNILVDQPKYGGNPRLEICDFGCCLAEEDRSLQVPFTSLDLFIGGNSWLMAPEISTKIAGPGSILDYRRSDLWAAGAIAYEILGAHNPFYPHGGSGKKLSSKSYTEEELPPLPDDVPEPVKRLVFALLNRDPMQRPTARGASAVMHMVVLGWNPDRISRGVAAHGWVSVPGRKGRKPQVVFAGKERKMFQWVMVQSLALLCQLGLGKHSAPTDVKAIMRFLFLSRLSYTHFRESVRFF